MGQNESLQSANGVSRLNTSDTTVNRQSPWPEYPAFQVIHQDTFGTGTLSLQVRSTAFFKNNEFKNPLCPGYTLAGLFAEPVVAFRPDEKTTLRGGFHLLKYYGRDTLDRILPVMSVQFDVSRHFSMIFGTIYGTVNHGLIEPVQNLENYLINNYENGIQLLFNYPSVRSDIWLNWEQFIKSGDPFPEIFTVGIHVDFTLADWQGISLTAPFSSVIRHAGGEIDTYWGPSGTKLHLVYGLRLHLSLQDLFFTGMYGIQNFVDFVEVNPDDRITIPYGHGNYSRIGFETRIGNFEAGYWKSTDFDAPLGQPLFLSVSRKYPGYYQAGREMLVLKYQFERDLSRFLKLAVLIEPYYHFDIRRMDHSFSVYLLLNEEFFMAKTRNKT